MIRKILNLLTFRAAPLRGKEKQFNAELLEQHREAAFLAMHQPGGLR